MARMSTGVELSPNPPTLAMPVRTGSEVTTDFGDRGVEQGRSLRLTPRIGSRARATLSAIAHPAVRPSTKLEFTNDGVHVEFSRQNGDGRWPDITPPGRTGPLQYTMGMAEYINGGWTGQQPFNSGTASTLRAEASRSISRSRRTGTMTAAGAKCRGTSSPVSLLQFDSGTLFDLR
jgi:hypothetical protein